MTGFEEIDKLARNIEQHAFRRGYVSAFTLTAFPMDTGEEMSVHITRECDGLVYGNAEVGTHEAFNLFLKALDGRVDYIVCDIALPFDNSEYREGGGGSPRNSILLSYSDLDVWVGSVKYTLVADIPDLKKKKVVLIGTDVSAGSFMELLTSVLRLYSREVGSFVTGEESGESGLMEALEGADVIVGAAIYKNVITQEQIEACGGSPLIVDAGIGTVDPGASEYALNKGLKMIRVDNRAAMAGTLFSLIQSYDLVTRVMGKGEIAGVPVVAGGVIGAPGTVVVDSIDRPSMAIGFADGTGRIHYDPDDEDESMRLEKVREYIREGNHE